MCGFHFIVDEMGGSGSLFTERICSTGVFFTALLDISSFCFAERQENECVRRDHPFCDCHYYYDRLYFIKRDKRRNFWRCGEYQCSCCRSLAFFVFYYRTFDWCLKICAYR